jgi:archaetidylinositol phosphate synthase
MTMTPWDQQVARRAVKPLAGTAVRPNHITTLTLFLAVGGAVLLALGDVTAMNWGAGLFVLARFLDHFDGELARAQGTGSTFGYYYDYVSGSLAYIALFVGIGAGLNSGMLGVWALVLGAVGAAAAAISLFLNLGIDRVKGGHESGEAIGYPARFGFELEDGIYLLAPITWIGLLEPFFVLSGIGAAVYLAWTFWSYLRQPR